MAKRNCPICGRARRDSQLSELYYNFSTMGRIHMIGSGVFACRSRRDCKEFARAKMKA